jgi:hypothetical protein
MSETRYYIEDWCDEVVPCSCSLEAWARWLSAPDPEWSRPEAAASGSVYISGVTRFEDLVLAEPTDGKVLVMPDPRPTGDWFAVRHGPGLGWDPDGMYDKLETLIEEINEHGIGAGELHVACAHDEGRVQIRFDMTAGGPRCVILGPVGAA